MSILANIRNVYIISQEKYINSLYANVESNSYNIHKALFAIETPFYSRETKCSAVLNKNNEDVIAFKAIRTDIALVQEYYNKNQHFISQILKNTTDRKSIKEDIEETPDISNKSSDINSNKRKKDVHEQKNSNREAIGTCNKLLEHSRNFNQSFESFHGSNTTDKAIVRKFKENEFLFPEYSTFYCQYLEKTLSFPELFDIIVMDPPWWNKAIRRKNLQQNAGYPMMFNEDIEQLPINSWLNDHGVVIVWCTNSQTHLQAVENFFQTWGLTFCAKWYWLKVTQSGQPIIPFGEPPRKQPFEQILIGCKKSNSAWCSSNGKLIISVPSAIHSHKPPLVNILKEIAQSEENLKGMELFARYLLPGWTSVGTEVLKLQNLSFYTKNDINVG